MAEFLRCENVIGCNDFGRTIEIESLSINTGDFVSVIGDNASGKDLFVRILAGLYPLKSGKLTILGRDFSSSTYEQIQKVRARTGYVFSTGALISNLTIFDNIALPLRYHYKAFAKNFTVKRIERWMRYFQIWEFKDLRPAFIPMEVAKKTLFCRAMIMKPSGVFYEEPFVGLGIKSRKFIKDFFIKTHLIQKTPAVMAVSDIDMVYDICNKMIVLKNGKIYKIINSADNLVELVKNDETLSTLITDVR